MSVRARLFIVFAVVVGGGFYFLVEWVQDELRPRYLESLEEPLVDMAHVLAEVAAGEMGDRGLETEGLRAVFDRAYARRFSAHIYAVEKQRVDIRVYVTDDRGVVVFDSDRRRDEGRDYSRWNDVYRTLRDEYGARITHEDPLYPGSAVLYIAAPIRIDGELRGVVSVGKPARNVDLFLTAARSKIAIAGAVAAVLVLLAGLVFTLWVTRPLDKLAAYARAVKAGRRVPPPRLRNDEIGALGEAMEEMRVALEGRDYAERYVHSLTHELKSPIAAIRGAAELLQEDPPAEQRRRFASNVHTQAARLQDLVERLLELAALEKRQELERREAVDLRVLAEEAVDGLRPLAEPRGIEFRVDVPIDGPVTGDPWLLQQALVNLLRNALAFSPDGGEIRLDVDPSAPEGRVCLRVSDQGPGLPDYALPRVFERFYSLPAPDQGKGTGLGLSFVQEVAALHGGDARLENRSGGGAQAVLCLPAGN